MDRPLLELTEPATLEGVRALRRGLLLRLEQLGLESREQDRWLLGLSEAATNVVRHTRPEATRLILCLRQQGDEMRLELLDDGGAPAPIGPVSHPGVAEGGYGLLLLSTLFDELSSTTRDGLNLLTLRRAGALAAVRPTLLVIDDDRATRVLLECYLKEHYQVISVASTEVALSLIAPAAGAARRVDLVLSDIEMEGTDGIAFRRRLMRDAATGVIPFVFLTAHQDEETQTRVSALGIDDLLAKPVDKRTLLRTVDRVLKRANQLQQQWGDTLDRRFTAALRPELEPLPIGWRGALRTRNASRGGGDLLLSRGPLLWLGDVMGHDEVAKFFAHAYAGYLRGLLLAQGAQPPAALLEHLSGVVRHDPTLGAALITGMVIKLEPEGHCRFASAGHPLPWRISAAGATPEGEVGPLPGLLAQGGYQEWQVQLKAGERLLLLTDGLVESRTGVEECLAQVLARTASLPLEQAADDLLAWFDGRHPDGPEDDMTLILLEASL
ncbi:SpoIIE family protein phosphatase [Aeromonas diversa]|nr:SpoIIE family protein phosphatase [Aeromonas diversa]